VQIRAWVDNAANAIGLSLYNFLNILNINQIWLYGRSCAFGEQWLESIVKQTGFNPLTTGYAASARHPNWLWPADPRPAADGDRLSVR
jgi:predicted NBD/HSP70 family sugar kinase